MGRQYFRAKSARKARAALATQEPTRITLEVDMEQFYSWLEGKLPRHQIDAVRRINSRDEMLSYFEDYHIDFVFPEFDQVSLDLPDRNRHV